MATTAQAGGKRVSPQHILIGAETGRTWIIIRARDKARDAKGTYRVEMLATDVFAFKIKIWSALDCEALQFRA